MTGKSKTFGNLLFECIGDAVEIYIGSSGEYFKLVGRIEDIGDDYFIIYDKDNGIYVGYLVDIFAVKEIDSENLKKKVKK